MAELPPFTQTTGLAQGNNRNPLSFAILLKDQIRVLTKFVEVMLYADDLVVYESNRFQMPKALARLHEVIIDSRYT